MNEDKIKHEPVQTYAEDMAKAIEGSSGGLIKKIIHGEKEHEKEKMNLSPESKKNKILMFLSLIFLFLTVMIVSFFLFFNKEINTVPIEKQFAPLIFNDKSAFIEVKELKKDEIAQTVLNKIDGTQVKMGGVEGIYLSYDKKVIGLRKFMMLLGGNLVLKNDNFVDDNFLMGVVNNSNKTISTETLLLDGQASAGKDFFIILKMRTLPDIFNTLRMWENKMFFDLHGFFGVALSPETKHLLTANFKDGVVENKNARILYDENDSLNPKIVMMYVFADDNSVIITNTENAVREIMLRLASSRVKK